MSLVNKHIFILGTAKFDGPEQSTSFNIARELSKSNFVYYIDYPVTLKDRFFRRKDNLIKFRKKYFSPFSDGLIVSDFHNLKIVICPLMLSINFLPEGILYRSLLRINENLIRRRIKKVLQKENIQNFIYINSFNFHYPGIADTLNTSLTVYQCVDPMIMPYDIKHGIISELELVTKSDLVICTSRQLCNEKLMQNPNTYFIPNAADISRNIKAALEDHPVDEYVSIIKKPIVGYIGAIERRFNYQLLKQVVDQNKDKSFVFVGTVSKDFVPNWFFETENIHIRGRVPFSEIPGIIKSFDITIIPFKQDPVSATIFPLKLFEYMGAGKAVVATNFNPDLGEFTEGLVSFCEDADHFSTELNRLLLHDSEDLRKRRIAVAKENTWEKRGQQIIDLLDLNLTQKYVQQHPRKIF